MKKRFLMILTEYPPRIGGMQTHAILLTRHLYERGMEVIVYTYRPNDDGDACRAIDAETPFPVRRTLSRVSYFRSVAILTDAVREFAPDLVYSSTVFFGILQELTGVPVVCRSVGNDILRPWIVYPFRFASGIVSSGIVENYLYNLYKRIRKPELAEIVFRKKRLALTIEAARAARKILANSGFTRRLLLESGVPRGKIRKVVGGVDAAFFKRPKGIDKKALRTELGLPADRKMILTACRIVDKKGVDFLIRVIGAARREKRNWHLVVVGDGRRAERYRDLARVMGLADRITFTGAVPYHRMPPFYWAADVFVLASIVFRDPLTGLSDAETMGRVLCEANAAGTPVAATRSGGIPSVIVHRLNGLLFAENDEIGCARCVDTLLENRELRRELAANGRRIAKERFDWAHILYEHEAVFREVMRSSRAPAGKRAVAAFR